LPCGGVGALGIGGKSAIDGFRGGGAWSERERWGGDEGLGFVELFSSHELGEGFEAIEVGIVAGSECAGVPGVGRDVVEWQTLATFVEIGEEVR
jgi:hypothetical protein